jgi:cell division transport system ATP-binding protein
VSRAGGDFILMLRFDHVSKVYKGNVTALRDVSIDVQKGEFIFLVGPSGSGKSTFLRLLLKEEDPTGGRIIVAGRDISSLAHWKVPQLRRNIGTIFQDFKLLPTRTVYENVAFAMEVIGRPRTVIRDPHPGSAGARPRGPGQEGRASPERAVRR